MPLLSVIVPVYNTETYLPSCIESILSQSFTDFEVLLIDDGSTDGSSAVCERFAKVDSRVRFFHQENKGVSTARNLGIENAKGTWLCFVDSDDELLPGGLAELVGGISEDIDFVMMGIARSIYFEKGSPILREKGKVISRNEAVLSMFNDTGLVYQGYSVAKLFRRDIIVTGNLSFDPSIIIKEDTLFVVNYLCLSNKHVYFSPTPVYYYFVKRPSSAMESLNESYHPKYLTSFEATVRIYHLVESHFPKDRKLLYASREELLNRVNRIRLVMITHNAVDNGIISQLKKRAIREVGLPHYLGFEIRRDKRRVTRLFNKLFKTHFSI